MYAKQANCNRYLALDDSIFVFDFKKSSRHDVEVCSHRCAESSAVTGCEAECTDNDGISALCDKERDADTDCDDGEGCETIAHDDGEYCHGDAVDRAGNQFVSFRDYLSYAARDNLANACGGEQ